MLRIILLSFAWGIASTCLVRPWFWIGVFKRDLYRDDSFGKIGFRKNNLREEIGKQVFLFAANFAISIIMYYGFATRQNFFGSLPMIIFCLISQLSWDNQGVILFTALVGILVFCCTLGIQEIYADEEIHMPNTESNIELTISNLQKINQAKQQNVMISPLIIQTLFGASKVTGSFYNNGKYIFVLQGGDLGDGVVVIDENDSIAHFISCNFRPEVETIRAEYPYSKLKVLNIYISENQTPYVLYGIAEKESLFGQYRVVDFLVMNMKNGVTEEYAFEDFSNILNSLS